jgi:PhnB protein
MPKRSLAEQLDSAIQALMTQDRANGAVENELAPLVRTAANLRNLPLERFKTNLKVDLERKSSMATVNESVTTVRANVDPVRKGFHTVTPYLIAENGPALLEFVKRAFGAEETFRGIGSAGGLHGELRFGDSMLMVGGGIPGREFKATANVHALHVYVQDADAVYHRALSAGATSVGEPADQEYGERSASVKDSAGNMWYIATHKGENYIPATLHNVNVYMHPLRADPVIRFLKDAFGAEELAKYASPDGVVHHAVIKVGTSVVEMGEAHGPYQPMKSAFYVYLPNVDAVYRKALAAGAKSLSEPADQPYGDRTAGVTDAFGNTWYTASHIAA